MPLTGSSMSTAGKEPCQGHAHRNHWGHNRLHAPVHHHVHCELPQSGMHVSDCTHAYCTLHLFPHACCSCSEPCPCHLTMRGAGHVESYRSLKKCLAGDLHDGAVCTDRPQRTILYSLWAGWPALGKVRLPPHDASPAVPAVDSNFCAWI